MDNTDQRGAQAFVKGACCIMKLPAYMMKNLKFFMENFKQAWEIQ